jgi:hypothetical protein
MEWTTTPRFCSGENGVAAVPPENWPKKGFEFTPVQRQHPRSLWRTVAAVRDRRRSKSAAANLIS